MSLQKTKNEKKLMIYYFFYFKCAINLNDSCRIICRKTKMCPLNITFLHTFLYRIAIKSMKSLFLKKNLTMKIVTKMPQKAILLNLIKLKSIFKKY